MTIDHTALQALFNAALPGLMALASLFFARIYWRRYRILSYCSIGFCVMLLDYTSNGGRFDALAQRAMMLTAIAIGLQIAWDGYRAGRDANFSDQSAAKGRAAR
ncbi:hypothetical protein AB1286_08580 [Trinickia sp. NRRL B-1857]|uniref:hypothetical protein n=1 Tax=Trinickia sp. NRRL B-1857 TaxID=3162879 RepID=UPI003D29C5E4